MKLIPHWREWLSQRPDSEHWQALIRVGLVGATLLILSVAQWPSVEPQRLQLARWVLLGSLVFSLSLSALVALGPSASVPRRLLGMLHDVVMVSLALYLCEAVLAPYAAIYLIGSVGNGFRFGTKYLYLCTVLSAASFGLVYVFSDYWQAQATLSLSIAVMITAVPLYAGHLLSTLNRSKAQLRLQATEDSLTSFLNRAELGLRLTQLFYR
jgi:two-component system sensor histidine kinase RpfC